MEARIENYFEPDAGWYLWILNFCAKVILEDSTWNYFLLNSVLSPILMTEILTQVSQSS